MSRFSALLVGSALLAGGVAGSAKAQVWVDAGQLNGKLPDWVDPQYYHVDSPQRPLVVSHPRLMWVEPVYRTGCRKVWREPVMEVIHECVRIDGHYETHEVVYDDCCGSRRTRKEQVWVPEHFEDRTRQLVRIAGYWESINYRELVTPGHWETVILRD